MSTLHGEYRRHERTPIKTKVSLSIENQGLATRTRDVSESGLCITKPRDLQLEAGQTVQVTFDRMANFSVPATIIRVSNNQIGLSLDHLRFSEHDISSIIKTSPWHQRFLTSCRRSFWRAGRISLMLSVNTLLRKVLLKWLQPDFVFAVYGDAKQVGTYATPRTLRMIPPLIIGGIIRSGKRTGVMVAPKYLEQELAQDSDKVRAYLQQLEDEFGDVGTVALSGRLPNFVMKAGCDINAPYIDGSSGTRYLIWDVARQMQARPEFKQENVICVLGGAGRIGSKTCEDLAQLFPLVIAFDPRYSMQEEVYTPNGKIIRTSDYALLKNARLFIGLTQNGDAIRDLMCYIPSGSLIADDTHPSISYETRQELRSLGISVEKTALQHADFNLWPRLPGWNNRAIPGCLVEALVLLEQERDEAGEFSEFCATANALGFHGKLFKPVEE